jgi:hypothetical protein
MRFLPRARFAGARFRDPPLVQGSLTPDRPRPISSDVALMRQNRPDFFSGLLPKKTRLT